METGFDTYMNSGYKFDRIDKKTLLVRWVASNASQTEINLDLVEPFRLDVHSDIYLDNFTTFVSTPPTGPANSGGTAFVLRINEFNIQSNVAGDSSGDNRGHMFNNIVIPADSFYNVSCNYDNNLFFIEYSKYNDINKSKTPKLNAIKFK